MKHRVGLNAVANSIVTVAAQAEPASQTSSSGMWAAWNRRVAHSSTKLRIVSPFFTAAAVATQSMTARPWVSLELPRFRPW